MLRLLILSLLTGAPPPPSTVQGFVDTDRLVTMCNARGPDAEPHQSICMGYVVGAMDQLMAQQARREEPRRTICPPKAMTVNEAVAAVVKYSRFATTTQGVGAAGFVRLAMEATYPCRPRGVGQ